MRPAPRPEPPPAPTAMETLSGIMDALHVPRETSLDELPGLVAVRCRPIRREDLLGLIQGGLIRAIDAHGPINHDNASGAALLVAETVLAVLEALRRGEDRDA